MTTERKRYRAAPACFAPAAWLHARSPITANPMNNTYNPAVTFNDFTRYMPTYTTSTTIHSHHVAT